MPLAAAGVVDRANDFSRLFCASLAHVDPSGAEFGPCARWIDAAPSATATLGDFPRGYRVLIVPGFLAECVADTLQTYDDAAEHLRADHGFVVERVRVPAFGSCAQNGLIVAAHIRSGIAEDPSRPYIVVGYSKGVADALEGLAHDDEARRGVAALVSVAGVVAGSRAVDQPEWLRKAILRLGRQACGPSDEGAFDDASRARRLQFLATHADSLPMRMYCVVAVSDEATTSSILRPGWEAMARFALEQDSQVVAYEGILAGASFLGVMRGDHWAVAMPFEDVREGPWKGAVNRNHFPREALFEALLRFVVIDIEGSRR